ncbi:hypothetical protein D3C73_995120 [compost metagenome]
MDVVSVESSGPPARNSCGMSNIVKPPTIDVISVNSRMVRRLGSVIRKKVWNPLAPSIAADSKSAGLIPITPAISTIIVFPYHIQNWINATMPRAVDLSCRKLIGASDQPSM